jgi:hypothetical protein
MKTIVTEFTHFRKYYYNKIKFALICKSNVDQHTITSNTDLRYISDLIINAVIVDPGFNITLNIYRRAEIRQE